MQLWPALVSITIAVTRCRRLGCLGWVAWDLGCFLPQGLKREQDSFSIVQESSQKIIFPGPRTNIGNSWKLKFTHSQPHWLLVFWYDRLLAQFGTVALLQNAPRRCWHNMKPRVLAFCMMLMLDHGEYHIEVAWIMIPCCSLSIPFSMLIFTDSWQRWQTSCFKFKGLFNNSETNPGNMQSWATDGFSFNSLLSHGPWKMFTPRLQLLLTTLVLLVLDDAFFDGRTAAGRCSCCFGF